MSKPGCVGDAVQWLAYDQEGVVIGVGWSGHYRVRVTASLIASLIGEVVQEKPQLLRRKA